jgi:protein-tyrosine phosphatase
MVKINFVCTGNICRSQMAQMQFQEFINQKGEQSKWFIDSSGISAEESGNTIWEPARHTLQLHNIPVLKHKSRRITKQDLQDFDLILVMTKHHLDYINKFLAGSSTGENEGNVYMYRQFTDSGIIAPSEKLDVIDPWYGPDEGFKDTYEDIEKGLQPVYEFAKSLR